MDQNDHKNNKDKRLKELNNWANLTNKKLIFKMLEKLAKF